MKSAADIDERLLCPGFAAILNAANERNAAVWYNSDINFNGGKKNETEPRVPQKAC